MTATLPASASLVMPVPRPVTRAAGWPVSAAMTAEAAVVLPMPTSPVAMMSRPLRELLLDQLDADLDGAHGLVAGHRRTLRHVGGAHADLLLADALGGAEVGVHADVGDDDAGADVPADHVDAGAAGDHVEDHRRRDLRRERADALGGHAVVGGHDGDRLVRDDRLLLALDAGELDGERLEAAERLGRLGELQLARLGGAHGVGVERADGGDGAVEQVGHWGSFGGDEGSSVDGMARPAAAAGGGQRLDVERVAGDEQVEAVRVAGEALVGPAELVAVQAGERVLGDDPEPDLVGDGDEGDAGLGDGRDEAVDGGRDARRGGALLVRRQQVLVVVVAVLRRLAAAEGAAAEEQVGHPEGDAVEQDDGGAGGPCGSGAPPAAPAAAARTAAGTSSGHSTVVHVSGRDGLVRAHALRHLLVVGLGRGDVGHPAAARLGQLRREPLGVRALAAARAAGDEDEPARDGPVVCCVHRMPSLEALSQ